MRRGALLSIAGGALMTAVAWADRPPEPEPAPACDSTKLAKIPKLACPRKSEPLNACPDAARLDMANEMIIIPDAVISWCWPFDDDDSRKGVTPFSGGGAIGPYAIWYADGKPAHRGQFPLGGTWQKWYPNHQLASVKYYDGSSLIGAHTEWYANGHKAFVIHYDRSGRRNGTATWWYENGKIKTRGRYRRDLEHGDWIGYDLTGAKTDTVVYVDGQRR